MLPLKKDWLIRPLFYISSLDAKLQSLAQSITYYLKEVIVPVLNSNEYETISELFPSISSLLMLVFYLLTEYEQASTPTEKKTEIVLN